MPDRFPHRDGRPLDSRIVAAIAVICLSAGCSGRNITADNPVVGLVPIRMAAAESAATHSQGRTADARGAATDIDQVSYDDAHRRSPQNLEMSDVAAVVNGIPILVSDILEPHALELAKAEKLLSPARFAEEREKLIRRDLPHHIDKTVMMDAALSELDAEKRAQVEQQLDEIF